ncbi:MAG: hypothetical protein AAF170_03625, partial [Bacteroidota bacterium]
MLRSFSLLIGLGALVACASSLEDPMVPTANDPPEEEDACEIPSSLPQAFAFRKNTVVDTDRGRLVDG